MTYVITSTCLDLKDMSCIEECPVDCIYEGGRKLYIQPRECIDCGACEPECPTTAIFEESELPAKWNVYKDINALVSGAKKVGEVDTASWPDHLKTQASTAATWNNITEQKKPLPGADDAAKE